MAKPAARRTVFAKVLTGYLAVTLFVLTATGGISYVLIENYIRESNLRDLTDKAVALTHTLADETGALRPLGRKNLREMERLINAQIVYVDSDMVARQLPAKDRRSATPTPAPSPAATPCASASPEPAATPEPSSDDPPAFPGELDLPGFERAEPPFDYFRAGQEREDDDTALRRIALVGSVDEALIRSIMSGENASDIRKLQFSDTPVMFAGTPFKNAETGETQAAIILCRPLSDIGEMAWGVLQALAVAAVFALALSIFIAYFVSKRLTDPIRHLSHIAGRMAEGHYGEPVWIRSDDEIKQLGDTLGLLSARLDEVIGTLNDEKSRLEQIVASIGEGIVAVDKRGCVIHHNAAALALLECDRWPLDDAVLARRALPRQFERAMSGENRVTTTWRTEDKRTIEATATPIRNTDREVIGAVCLLRDISEAQRLEQMRRDYIANISHELRTPLTGIRGMVEPLLDGLMDTEQAREDCYRVIYQETIRLEKLIGEMLDLSRLQDGRVQIELEPMQPQPLLEAAERRLRDRAKAAGVALTVDASPALCVLGNEDRIMQVLIILLDNALSFTPTGGTVTLFARALGSDRVAMGVADTGAGIDPADVPYIWERFYKADKSRMRTSGTGLGLSIAKLAVELMNGEITVETRLGVGSTFTFTLAACSPPETRR